MNHIQHVNEHKAKKIQPNGFAGVIAANSNLTIEKSFQKKGTSFVNAFDNANVVIQDCATPGSEVASTSETVATRINAIKNGKVRNLLPMWIHYVLKRYTHDQVNNYQSLSKSTGITIKPVNYDINEADYDATDVNDINTIVSGYRADIFNQSITNNPQVSWSSDGKTKYVNSDYSLESRIAANRSIDTNDIDFTSKGYYVLYGVESSIRSVWPLDEKHEDRQDNPDLNLHLYDRIVYPMKSDDGIYIKYSDDVFAFDSYGNKIEVEGSRKLKYSPVTHKKIAETVSYRPTYFYDNGYRNVKLASVDAAIDSYLSAKFYLQFHINENTAASALYFMGPYDNNDSSVCYQYEFNNATVTKNDINPTNFYFRYPNNASGAKYNLFDYVNGNYENLSKSLSGILKDRLTWGKNTIVNEENADALSSAYYDESNFYFTLDIKKIENSIEFTNGGHRSTTWIAGLANRDTANTYYSVTNENINKLCNSDGEVVYSFIPGAPDDLNPYSDDLDQKMHFYMLDTEDDNGEQDLVYIKPQTNSIDRDEVRTTFKPIVIYNNNSYTNNNGEIEWEDYAKTIFNESDGSIDAGASNNKEYFTVSQKISFTPSISATLSTIALSVPENTTANINLSIPYQLGNFITIDPAEKNVKVKYSDIFASLKPGVVVKKGTGTKYGLDYFTQQYTYAGTFSSSKVIKTTAVSANLSINSTTSVISTIDTFADTTNFSSTPFTSNVNDISKYMPGLVMLKPNMTSNILPIAVSTPNTNTISGKLSEILSDYTSSNSSVSIATNCFEFNADTAKINGYKDKSTVDATISNAISTKIGSLVNSKTAKERFIENNAIEFSDSEATNEMFGVAIFTKDAKATQFKYYKVRPEGFVHIEFDENDVDAYAGFLGEDDNVGANLVINAATVKKIAKTLQRLLFVICNNKGYDILLYNGGSLRTSNVKTYSGENATFENIGWTFASCIYSLGYVSTGTKQKTIYIKSIDFIDKKYAEEFSSENTESIISSYQVNRNEYYSTDFSDIYLTSGTTTFDYSHHKCNKSSFKTLKDNKTEFKMSEMFEGLENTPLSATKVKIETINPISLNYNLNNDYVLNININEGRSFKLSGNFNTNEKNALSSTYSVLKFKNHFISQVTISNNDVLVSGNLSAKFSPNCNVYSNYVLKCDDFACIDEGVINNMTTSAAFENLFQYEDINEKYLNIGGIISASDFNEDDYKPTCIFTYDPQYKETTVNAVDDIAKKSLKDVLETYCGYKWENNSNSDTDGSFKCSYMDEDSDVTYEIKNADNVGTSLVNGTIYTIDENGNYDENNTSSLSGIVSATLTYTIEKPGYEDISGYILNSLAGEDSVETIDIAIKNLLKKDFNSYIKTSIETSAITSSSTNVTVNATSGINAKLTEFKNAFFAHYDENQNGSDANPMIVPYNTGIDQIIETMKVDDKLFDECVAQNTYGEDDISFDMPSTGTYTYDQLDLNDKNTLSNLSCMLDVNINVSLNGAQEITSSFIRRLSANANVKIDDPSSTSASFTMGIMNPSLTSTIEQTECDEFIPVQTSTKSLNDVIGILTGIESIDTITTGDAALKAFKSNPAELLASQISGNLWKDSSEKNITPANDLFAKISGNIKIVSDTTKENGYCYKVTDAWTPDVHYINGYKLTDENSNSAHELKLYWQGDRNIASVDMDIYAGDDNFLYLYWDSNCQRPMFTDDKGYLLVTGSDGNKVDGDENERTDSAGQHYKHIVDYSWTYDCEYEKANFNDWYDAEAYVNYSSLNEDTGLDYSLSIGNSDYITYSSNYVTLSDHDKIKTNVSLKNVDELRNVNCATPIVITSNCTDKSITVIDNGNNILASDRIYNTYASSDNFSTLFTGIDTDEFVREQSYKAFSFNFKLPKDGWTKLSNDQYSLNENYAKQLTTTNDICELQKNGIFKDGNTLSSFVKSFSGRLMVKINSLKNLTDEVFSSFSANSNYHGSLSSFYDYDIYNVSWTAILRKENTSSGDRWVFTLTSNNDTISFSDVLTRKSNNYSAIHTLRNVVIPTTVNDNAYNVVISNLKIKITYNDTLKLSIIDGETSVLSSYDFYYNASSDKSFDWTKSINNDIFVRNSATQGLLNNIYATSDSFVKFKFTNSEWNTAMTYCNALSSAISGTAFNYSIYNYYAGLLLDNYGISSNVTTNNGRYSISAWSMSDGTLQNPPAAGTAKFSNSDAEKYSYLYSNLIDSMPTNTVIDMPEVMIRPGEFIFTSNDNEEALLKAFEEKIDKENYSMNIAAATTVSATANSQFAMIYDMERLDTPYDATIPLFLYQGSSTKEHLGKTFNSDDEIVMVNARKMYEAPTYSDSKPNDGSLDLNLASLYDKEIELTAMIDLSYYVEGESPFKEIIPYVDDNLNYSYLYSDANSNEIALFDSLNRRQVRYTNFKPKTPLYRLYALNADVDFYSVDNVKCKFDTPSNSLSTINDSNNGIEIPFKLKMSFNNLIFQEKIREGVKYDDIDNVTCTDRIFDANEISTYINVITGDLTTGGGWGMTAPLSTEYYNNGIYSNVSDYVFEKQSELTGSEYYLGGEKYKNDILNATTMKDTVSDWNTEYTSSRYGKFDIYTDYNPTTTKAAHDGRYCVGTPYFNVLDKKIIRKSINEGTSTGSDGVTLSSVQLAAIMKIATDAKYVANVSNVKNINSNTTIDVSDIVKSDNKSANGYIKEGNLTYSIIDIKNFDSYLVVKCSIEDTTVSDYSEIKYIEFSNNDDRFTFMIYMDGLLYDKDAVVVENNVKNYTLDNNAYTLHSVKSSNIILDRSSNVNPNVATLHGQVELYFTKGSTESANEMLEIHNVKLPAPTIKSMTVMNPYDREIENGGFYLDDNKWRSKVVLTETAPSRIEKGTTPIDVKGHNFYTFDNLNEDIYFSFDEGNMLGGSLKERYDEDGKLTGLMLTLKMSGLKKFKESGIKYVMKNSENVVLTDETLTEYNKLSSSIYEIEGYVNDAKVGDVVQSGTLQLEYNHIDTEPINMKLDNVGAYQYFYNPTDNDLFQLEVITKNKNLSYEKNLFYVNLPIDRWYNMTISRETKYPTDYTQDDLEINDNTSLPKNVSMMHFYLTDIEGNALEDIASTSREVFDISTLNDRILDGKNAGVRQLSGDASNNIKTGLWNYDIDDKIKFDACSRKSYSMYYNNDKALAGAKLGISDDESDYGKVGRDDLIKITDKAFADIDFENRFGRITLFAGSTITGLVAPSALVMDEKYASNISDKGGNMKQYVENYVPRRVMVNNDDNYFVLRKKDVAKSFVTVPGIQCEGIMWISTPNLDSAAGESKVKTNAVSYTDSIPDSYKLVNEYVEFFKNCQHKLPPVKYVNKILDSDYAELIFNNCRNIPATANAASIDNAADNEKKVYTYENTPLTISYVWDNAKVSRTENAIGKNALAETTLLSWNKNLYEEYIAEIGSIYNFQDSENVVNMTISEIGQHKDRQIVVLPTMTTSPFKYTKLSDETGLITVVGKDPIVATAAMGYNGSGYPKNSVMYYNGNDSVKIDTTQTTYLYIKQTDSTTACKFGATQEKPVYVDTVSENTCSYSERYEFIPSPYISTDRREFTTDKLNTLIYGNSKKLSDERILKIVEASSELALSTLNDVNEDIVANNFYTAIVKTLKNYSVFNTTDSSITEYNDAYSSDTDVKNFTFVTNLLGQHYKADDGSVAVLQTTDYNVFNSDNVEDSNSYWQTMNCFYFDGTLLPTNGAFTSKFIDVENGSFNSNQTLFQAVANLETMKNIDIAPTMYVIWNANETSDTYETYKYKCDEIDNSTLGAGSFANFDSMGGINISGIRFKIKAEHITHAPTYIKISLLKYVKLNETDNSSELALRWVNDPAILDIDFTETYNEEYDFDNMVDKEINKQFISTFDSDDLCKHVFGIKIAIENIVPGQKNNNCCIIDSIKVFSSNMLNKYGNASNVEDVFVRKIDANCRNYYNFDVQQYVWHMPTTTQEWSTVLASLEASYGTDAEDKPMTDDMYEFLSGSLNKYSKGEVEESTSEDEEGYDNFSSYESIYISTDESSKSINEVLSDTYMSESSIKLTWKYVDYVYIYYSCYTPNSRALLQTYFGSTIVNMAIAKLKARVSDINANSSFSGKYSFTGGVSQMKEETIMSNEKSQIFTWSSSGSTTDNYTNVYESSPVYGKAVYITTKTTKTSTTTKKKKKTNTTYSTDVSYETTARDEYLSTLDTFKTTLDSTTKFSNVVENAKYSNVENWTKSFVPVSIKYILEE